MSNDEKTPIERAAELFVFAPLGMAMFVRDTLPTFFKMFVARGQAELAQHRRRLGDQASQYRTVGRVAVELGAPAVRRRAEQLGAVRRRAEETFAASTIPPGPGRAAAGANGSGTPVPRPSAGGPRAAAAVRGSVPARSPRDRTAARVGDGRAEVSSLPIPDYDELSASQVVERLEGLSREELMAVARYERTHRGRNTILGKVDQLTAPPS